MPVLRDHRVDDLPALLALNEAELPHVSSLELAEMARLAGMASGLRVAELDGRIAGFLLLLREGAGYDSPNYRWFAARYPRFLYVDRVLVAAEARRRGVGAALYRDLEARARAAGAPVLTCEVNVRPPNPGSIAFHERLGFVEVGQQDTDGGGKRVSLMARTLT